MYANAIALMLIVACALAVTALAPHLAAMW
jgi:hypothetical protein